LLGDCLNNGFCSLDRLINHDDDYFFHKEPESCIDNP
jgi:hypothetical protein